jgi:hypothetical protein
MRVPGSRTPEQYMSKKRRPWLELAPLPPNATPADLAEIHIEQMHGAVAKAIGKNGNYFAAAITISLDSEQSPRPHLIMARRYGGSTCGHALHGCLCGLFCAPGTLGSGWLGP